MNYKAYIYVVTMMLSAFALSGINFNKMILTNKKVETRILVILICICMSYLVTNFITDFLDVSALIKG